MVPGLSGALRAPWALSGAPSLVAPSPIMCLSAHLTFFAEHIMDNWVKNE